jgi:hypothetical protein
MGLRRGEVEDGELVLVVIVIIDFETSLSVLNDGHEKTEKREIKKG